MTTNHGFVHVGEERIDFSGCLGSPICWNIELEEWCAKYHHPCAHKDSFWVTTIMTKKQLLTFLREVSTRRHRQDSLVKFSVIQNEISYRLNESDTYLVEGFDY